MSSIIRSTRRKRQFAGLLDTEEFKDVFSEKFVDGLEHRKELLSTRSQKIQIVQWTVMLLLGLAVLSVHKRALASVDLRHAGNPDERSLFDVRKRCLDDSGYARVVSK
jgi:hypothetical protein